MIKKSIVSLVLSVMVASTASALELDTEVSTLSAGSSTAVGGPAGIMYYDAGNFDVAFGISYMSQDGESVLDLDLGVRTELPLLGESSIIARVGEDSAEDNALRSIRLTKSFRVEIADGLSLGLRANILNITLDDEGTTADDASVTLLGSIEPVVAVNVAL